MSNLTLRITFQKKRQINGVELADYWRQFGRLRSTRALSFGLQRSVFVLGYTNPDGSLYLAFLESFFSSTRNR